jgi:hypothetical protein
MPKSHNKTGRALSPERFVLLPHYLLNSAAWKGLSPTARAAWIHIVKRYNGANNGSIAVSTRLLGEDLNCSKNAAARAILDLKNAGLIEQTAASSFSRTQSC